MNRGEWWEEFVQRVRSVTLRFCLVLMSKRRTIIQGDFVYRRVTHNNNLIGSNSRCRVDEVLSGDLCVVLGL